NQEGPVAVYVPAICIDEGRVSMRFEMLNHYFNCGRVVEIIVAGPGDVFASGLAPAAVDRVGDTFIFLMDNADSRISAGVGIEHVSGVVARAVIDDDEFQVG